MKNLIIYFLLLLTTSVIAQVGLGTTTPTEMLDVKGDILLSDNVNFMNFNSVSATEENFKLITRVTNSSPAGLLKKLEPASMNIAPMRLQNYTFTNVNNDDVSDVDLQLSTTDYIVSVSNFRCIGDHLEKDVTNLKSSGLFVYRVYQNGGTWHLTIRNEYLNPSTSGTIDYEISLIIYQKRFFNQLPNITENLGGNQTGSASTVPL